MKSILVLKQESTQLDIKMKIKVNFGKQLHNPIQPSNNNGKIYPSNHHGLCKREKNHPNNMPITTSAIAPATASQSQSIIQLLQQLSTSYLHQSQTLPKTTIPVKQNSFLRYQKSNRELCIEWYRQAQHLLRLALWRKSSTNQA